jgi:peptidoglycan/LPS O-acetylase OafA/YrhL
MDVAAQYSSDFSINTPPRDRLHDLTCFRALTAGWVFIYHLNLQVHRGAGFVLLHRGYLGVDGFFLLSGLVLAYAHPVAPVRPAAALRFWARRLLRLMPVHLATLGVLVAGVAVAALAGVAIRDPGRFGWGELLRALALVHGWGFSARWAWNYPSWSISTEWAGYLAFPLLWLGVSRLSLIAAALLPLVALAVLAWVGDGPYGLNLTFQGGLFRFFPEFVAGLALARLVANLPAAFVLAGAGAFWLMAALFLPDAAVVAALWCVLAALTAGGLRGRRVLDRVPGLRWLGELSYSFYMSFALAELAAVALLRRVGALPAEAPAAYAALTTALALALAIALHRWVEQPALRRWGPRIG